MSAPESLEGDNLDRSALKGVAWSSIAKWSTQIFAWAGTVFVARILTPADIGLLTTASVFMGVIMILSEFGISTAVITMRELKPEDMGELNTFSVLLGVAGTLLAALMAVPLGAFFRAPELPPVLAVVGLTFMLTSMQTVPAALLRRELRFKSIAVIDVTRGLVVPVVTLVGALLGMRYWALAMGSVTGAALSMVMTLSFRRIGFRRPRLAALRPVLNFSRNVLVGRVAWIAYQDGDFAVAGRRLSMAAVGDYGMAWTLATSPIEKVTMMLGDVTPALFSAAQHDRPALRRYFLNLSELISLAVVPAAAGIALVSEDLVAVILGAKWEGVAAPLAVLALYAGARALTSLFGHLFNAVRETFFAMWTSIVLAVLLLTGFVIGSRWGPQGIAAAWLLIHPAFSVLTFTRVSRVLDLGALTYLRSLRLGVDGTMVMAAVVLVFQYMTVDSSSTVLRLVGSIGFGAGAFTATTFLVHRSRLATILAWMRRVRSGSAV